MPGPCRRGREDESQDKGAKEEATKEESKEKALKEEATKGKDKDGKGKLRHRSRSRRRPTTPPRGPGKGSSSSSRHSLEHCAQAILIRQTIHEAANEPVIVSAPFRLCQLRPPQ